MVNKCLGMTAARRASRRPGSILHVIMESDARQEVHGREEELIKHDRAPRSAAAALKGRREKKRNVANNSDADMLCVEGGEMRRFFFSPSSAENQKSYGTAATEGL